MVVKPEWHEDQIAREDDIYVESIRTQTSGHTDKNDRWVFFYRLVDSYSLEV